MLRESGLLTSLQNCSFSPKGNAMCIYGDPAYPHRLHLQAPCRAEIRLTEEQNEFNRAMSAVTVSVEWMFGDIVNFFKFLDFKKNLKVHRSAIGKMYIICSLLTNARTCLYGSLTSKYFNLDPQSLIYKYIYNYYYVSVITENVKSLKLFNMGTELCPLSLYK